MNSSNKIVVTSRLNNEKNKINVVSERCVEDDIT